MSYITIFAPAAAAGLALALVATQSMASDRSIRCGTHLIRGGGGQDSARMYEVMKKCGEPEAKYGDTWIYVQGSMRRILTFNWEGKVLRIESERR